MVIVLARIDSLKQGANRVMIVKPAHQVQLVLNSSQGQVEFRLYVLLFTCTHVVHVQGGGQDTESIDIVENSLLFMTATAQTSTMRAHNLILLIGGTGQLYRILV